jgi:hypothetical protein
MFQAVSKMIPLLHFLGESEPFPCTLINLDEQLLLKIERLCLFFCHEALHVVVPQAFGTDRLFLLLTVQSDAKKSSVGAELMAYLTSNVVHSTVLNRGMFLVFLTFASISFYSLY